MEAKNVFFLKKIQEKDENPGSLKNGEKNPPFMQRAIFFKLGKTLPPVLAEIEKWFNSPLP